MSNGEVPFIEAWEAHHRAVYRACLLLTRSRDDADEAYSRTAVNAFQRWPAGIPTLDDARRWLCTVARNACHDIFRERNRRREISLDTEIASTGDVAVAAIGVEDDYLAREQMLRVLQCLQQLPFRLRRPAELHFVRDLPYRDVARHLEISEVNVRKRIQQAKAVLRRAIAEEPHSAPAVRDEGPAGEAAPPLSLFAAVVETNDRVHRDAEIALPLARAATAQQLAALRDYVETHPRGWRRRLALARALVTAGAWREAVPHYRHALAKHPFAVQPWLELGTVLTVLESREEAAAVYCEGSERTSREADRLQLRARAEALRGDPERAWSILHDLSRDEDAGALARKVRARGELSLARGRVVEAARTLEQALALDPADPLARLLHHDALLAWGRPLAAREQLVEVLRRGNGGLPAIERFIAMGCRARAASEETRPLLQTLREEAPLRAGTHAAVALVALAAGRGEEAEATLRASVAANRRHAVAWLWLARIRGAVGAHGPALMAAFTSLALDRDHREAWLTAGELARHVRESSSARALWPRIRDAFPDDPLLLAEGALLAASSGAYDAAMALAAAARDLEPELSRLHVAQANVLAAAGRHEDAAAVLREAWELLPRTDSHEDAARAALLLAHCHGRVGEQVAERAWLRVAALRAALLEDTDPALSFFLRGEALAAMQSPREALAAYRGAAARHLPHPWRRVMTDSMRRIVARNSQTPRAGV